MNIIVKRLLLGNLKAQAEEYAEKLNKENKENGRNRQRKKKKFT